MNCPSCKIKVIGSDCPTCATKVVTACPDCEAAFLPCDQYCRNCGRELRFINFTNHTRLKDPREIRIEQYEYPADRDARRVMAGLWPIKVIARYGIEKFSQSTLHGTLLGSTVKVSDKQFPALKRASDVCMRMLDMKGVEVFISRSSVLAAQSYGVGGRNFIVLTSGLVETLDYDELLFIIGRQLGQIKSDHLLYLSIIDTVKKGVKTIPMFGNAILEIVSFILLPWQRSSQLTADRAGLICCQSIQTATKALTKIALGSRELFDKVDLDEFLQQYQDLQEEGAWGEYMQVNPFVLTRIRKLQSFIESPSWKRIMNEAYSPNRPQFTCYYCDAKYELKDFDAKLKSLCCDSCKRKLHIDELFCPHCGTKDNLAGRDISCSGFTCSACERPYFIGDERKLMEAYKNDLPKNSPYSILSVHHSASPEEVAQAYVKAMHEDKGEERVLSEKLAIDKAYRELINTRRRCRVDSNLKIQINRKLYGKEEEKTRRCHQCGVITFGEYCGHCGGKRQSEDGTGKPSSAKHSPQIRLLKESLAKEEAFGDGIVFFEDNPFDISFKVSPHTYFIAIVEGDLDSPSSITSVIQECNKRSEQLTRQSWLHASASFVLVTLGKVDTHLLQRLVKKDFAYRRGMTGTFDLEILAKTSKGTLERLVLPEQEEEGKEAPITKFDDFDHLARQMAKERTPSTDT